MRAILRASSRLQGMEGGGACTRQTEYSSKRFLSKSSVQKGGGGAFLRELTVLTQKLFMINVISPMVKVTSNASGLIFGDNV